MNYCPHCGSPIEKANAFCPRCGAPIPAARPAAPAANQYAAPNSYRAPISVSPLHDSAAQKLSTFALIALVLAVVFDFIGDILFYVSLDLPGIMQSVLPHTLLSILVTTVFAAIIPVFCKIAVATKAKSCAPVVKICAIISLAVQIIAVMLVVIFVLIIRDYLGSPLYQGILRIPGAGLLNQLLSLFSVFSYPNPLMFISDIIIFFSCALYIANNVLCLIAAFKFAKS